MSGLITYLEVAGKDSSSASLAHARGNPKALFSWLPTGPVWMLLGASEAREEAQVLLTRGWDAGQFKKGKDDLEVFKGRK